MAKCPWSYKMSLITSISPSPTETVNIVTTYKCRELTLTRSNIQPRFHNPRIFQQLPRYSTRPRMLRSTKPAIKHYVPGLTPHYNCPTFPLSTRIKTRRSMPVQISFIYPWPRSQRIRSASTYPWPTPIVQIPRLPGAILPPAHLRVEVGCPGAKLLELLWDPLLVPL